ncbi:ribonuclease HII [Actinomyces sp. F1_1611]
MLADLTREQILAEQYGLVAGVDEVGRGCLAGPVCVGLVVAPLDRPIPTGLTDSKLLSPSRRQKLVPQVEEWALAWALGWAGPDEVDHLGIVGALRAAGHRALAQIDLEVGIVLLDGNHDWFSDLWTPPVVTQVKADRDCASVAGASVLAKVARDRYMESLADPGYDWAHNKGYGSAKHRAALANLGVSDHHRKTWKLLTEGTATGG